MYLKLFHGRDTVVEDMEDWGYHGPIFEIKGFVHCTYMSILWVDHEGDGDGEWLSVVDGLVYYDGKFYGDWSVFAEPFSGIEYYLEPFDPKKAEMPREMLEELAPLAGYEYGGKTDA